MIEAKKMRTCKVASWISAAISASKDAVYEARIDPEVLRSFFKKRIETVRVAFFDEVRLPNVNKLSLYGRELVNTDIYRGYLKVGRVRYVVFEPEEGACHWADKGLRDHLLLKNG